MASVARYQYVCEDPGDRGRARRSEMKQIAIGMETVLDAAAQLAAFQAEFAGHRSGTLID
jgi:hypothetical protein